MNKLNIVIVWKRLVFSPLVQWQVCKRSNSWVNFGKVDSGTRVDDEATDSEVCFGFMTGVSCSCSLLLHATGHVSRSCRLHDQLDTEPGSTQDKDQV